MTVAAAPLTYFQAIVLGAVQGIAELFPVSSLGHAALIPAVIGGDWAKNLDISATSSPYLAFIVGLHVATAFALILFYRRDWVMILGGAVSSIRHRRIQPGPERLFWLLIAATIPVAILGLAFDKLLRTTLGKPIPVAIFLTLNGLVLIAAHVRNRSRRKPRHSLAALPDDEADEGRVDQQVSGLSTTRAVLVGTAQALALLPGISRSGVTLAAGERAGLSTRAAARFAFLLATPAILAAGVLKLPELLGPLGRGIGGQVLAGSAVAFVCAFLSVAFLDRYFAKRGLLPFAIYCVVAGLGCLALFLLR